VAYRGAPGAARLFGRAIRDARARRGLSQAALADRAWLAQPTISRLETGTLRGMRYATLMRVLAALDPRSLRLDVDRPGWYAELIGRYDHEGHHTEDLHRASPHEADRAPGRD
jgi:transcriptional regulator with XRE-family HTH domain